VDLEVGYEQKQRRGRNAKNMFSGVMYGLLSLHSVVSFSILNTTK
jgi:hypothetical protein